MKVKENKLKKGLPDSDLDAIMIGMNMKLENVNMEMKEMNMNMDLFNKIDYDVENGCSKEECIEMWGKKVIEEYEKFGVENDLFEGEWEE